MPRHSARPIAGAHPTPLCTPVTTTDRLLAQAIAVLASILPVEPYRPPRATSKSSKLGGHQQLADATHRLIKAGQRPSVRVVVVGVNGLVVQLVIDGMPGAIAHARTRRRARELARSSVASLLGLDPYAFDLEVDGA